MKNIITVLLLSLISVSANAETLEESQIDPITAALNAALMADDATPKGPELGQDNIATFAARIKECWNLGALSSTALSTVVVVEMELTLDGGLVPNSIKMLGFEGGDKRSATAAFEAAVDAIIECAAQGFDLPKDQYATWRRVELTFNPENAIFK